MNRKREQAILLTKVGQFFGPVISIAKNLKAYDTDEQTRILARFFHDQQMFMVEVTRGTKRGRIGSVSTLVNDGARA
jgi:hypothetical protein